MVKKMTKAQYLKYIMFHPIEGFEELRFNKAGSVKISMIILVIFFVAQIFVKQISGFIFTYGNKQQYNVFFDFFSVYGVISLLFVIGLFVRFLTERED